MSTLTDFYHALPVRARKKKAPITAGKRKVKERSSTRVFKFPDGHTVKAKARK